MRLAHLVVAEPRTPDGETELVECEVLADADGEREGNDLQVERARVAGRHLVEAVAVVRDDPGEDIDAPGRALGVGLAPQPGWKVEPLLELNEVGTPRFEHGAGAAEVDLVEDVVLQLPLDRIGPWEKAAADAQGPLTEAQIEAGGLHVGVGDVETPGLDVAGTDDPLEELTREHPFGCRFEIQDHGTRTGMSRLPPGTHRAKHVASPARKSRGGFRRSQPVDDLGRIRWT